MRGQDDVPYIVIEKESGGGLGPFILGALVGAGLALLFAPKSGEETQKELREQARKLRSAAEERVRSAQKSIESRLEVARRGVHDRVESVKEAVESGRQAAQEKRVELEEKLERSKTAYKAGIDAAREAAAAPIGDATDEVDAG